LKLGPPNYEAEIQRNLTFGTKKPPMSNNLPQKGRIIENQIKFVTSFRTFHGLK
jgi:hypothetical protein